MVHSIHKKQSSTAYKILCSFIAVTFGSSVILPPAPVFAQTVLNLPVPGTMVAPSPGFMPVQMTGLTIHPDNPLRFDFIMDTGHSGLDINSEEFKQESAKLIKYFMASLTTPENELWVNLSPYEKDRMIAEGLGKTEMGRDMLAQDYLLKQLTASLMYPEEELGKEFWKRVYQKAREKFGTTEIPLNTFNKIWIVPEDALVYEQNGSAFVIHSKLAVMLEEDYEALRQSKNTSEFGSQDTVVSGLQSQVVREVLIPEITKEINEGKNFANLRQIFNALILATWYKVRLRESLLGKVYVDQGKTKGIDVQDKEINDKIYTQYLEAFKKGVYNYIREDYDESTQQVIPRKYFSGGVSAAKMRNGEWFSQFLLAGGLVLGLTAFSALPSAAQEEGKNILEGVGNQAGVTAEFVENSPDDLTVTVHNGENVRPLLLAQGGEAASLREDLKNPEWEIQKRAAHELYRRNDKEGIELARELLVWPRIKNMAGIRQWGKSYGQGEEGNQIIELGEIAEQPLLENLQNKASEINTRKWSAHLLGIIGRFDKVFPVLHGILDSPKDYLSYMPLDHYNALKLETLNGIRKLFDRQPLNDLLTVLREEKNPDVIQWVLSSLGNFPDEKAIKALIPFFNQPGEYVAYSVLDSVNRILTKNAEFVSLIPVEEVVKSMYFEGSTVAHLAQGEAVKLLVTVFNITKDEKIVKKLIERLAEPTIHPSVNFEIELSLEKLAKSGSKEAIEYLKKKKAMPTPGTSSSPVAFEDFQEYRERLIKDIKEGHYDTFMDLGQMFWELGELAIVTLDDQEVVKLLEREARPGSGSAYGAREAARKALEKIKSRSEKQKEKRRIQGEIQELMVRIKDPWSWDMSLDLERLLFKLGDIAAANPDIMKSEVMELLKWEAEFGYTYGVKEVAKNAIIRIERKSASSPMKQEVRLKLKDDGYAHLGPDSRGVMWANQALDLSDPSTQENILQLFRLAGLDSSWKGQQLSLIVGEKTVGDQKFFTVPAMAVDNGQSIKFIQFSSRPFDYDYYMGLISIRLIRHVFFDGDIFHVPAQVKFDVPDSGGVDFVIQPSESASSPVVEKLLREYWEAGETQPLLLQEIGEKTGLDKKLVLIALETINNNPDMPFRVEPAGLHKKLDEETLWVRLVARRPLGESRPPPQSLQRSTSSSVGEEDLEEIKRLFREQIRAWYAEDKRELKSLGTFSWGGLKTYFTMDSEAAAMRKRFSKLEEIFKEKQNRWPTNQEIEDLLSALSKEEGEEGEAARLFLISAVMNDFIDDVSVKFIKGLFKGPASSPVIDKDSAIAILNELEKEDSIGDLITMDEGRIQGVIVWRKSSNEPFQSFPMNPDHSLNLTGFGPYEVVQQIANALDLEVLIGELMASMTDIWLHKIALRGKPGRIFGKRESLEKTRKRVKEFLIDQVARAPSPLQRLPTDRWIPDENSAKTGRELTTKLLKVTREITLVWEMSSRDVFVVNEIHLRESPRVIFTAISEFERKMPDEDISQATGEALIRWLYQRGVLAYMEGSEVKPASSPASSSVSEERVPTAARLVGMEATSDKGPATKGGIDLNPALLDLQIRRDGNGVPLPLPMQPIEHMHIEGFLPIIINVTPIANLPLLLGLVDTKQDADEITPAMKAREPEEVSYLN